MKHYDVGVTGIWFGANYGSLINGYATYKVLNALGCSVLMIHKPNAAATDWEIVNPHCASFINNFYPKENVSELLPYGRLRELNTRCDAFLVGSDQVWHDNLISGFKNSFLLNFASDEKRKLSFGSSFGHKNNTVPENQIPEVKRLFRRFHAISVREQSSADILRDVYGVKSTVTIEPIFCLGDKDYEQMAEKSTIETHKPYILSYILDPTPEIIDTIQYYCKLTGMESINILDGNPFDNIDMRKIFTLPNTPIEPCAEDLVNLAMNASFVITDSFHGTCLSIIFKKPFLSIANYWRGVARFTDLLTKHGLMDRLAMDENNLPKDAKFLEQLDYTKIHENIDKERSDSVAWLKNALETPIDKMPSILIEKYLKISKCVTTQLKEKNCAGCGACVSSCPKDALSLKPDVWGYCRASVEEVKCINCGLCAKVCPALNLPEKKNNPQPDCYAFIAKNEEVLESSSSGGAFPLLAREAFRRNGAVAGAAWRDDLYVEHIVIDDEKDLPKLQKSKYLQSYLGMTDREVKRRLDAGQFVLFSGCPCQVAGLKKYLGKEYENLILVDLLCGGAPSAEFFQKYLKDSFPNGVKNYQFRYKKQGWNSDCATLTLTLTDGTKIERRSGKQDDYQKLYHPHTMCAPHCEHCPYQALPRFGDITIGDFWGYEQHDSSIDVSRGLSVVLCNNEKGRAFFESLPESEIKVKKKVPLEWIGGNGYAYTGHNYCSPYRDKFYESIKSKSFSAAVADALYQGKTLEDCYNEAQWNLNAMNFCSELCLDFLGGRKFERFVQNLAGKKIAVLKVQDRAGKIFLKACENVGANVIFTSRSNNLDGLTEAEFAECKKADVVITCCVHGAKTHERDGVKCIDIWDILNMEGEPL